MTEKALDRLQSAITRRVGKVVNFEIAGSALKVVCQKNGAQITVIVDEPNRPSFNMSYPAFMHDAQSWNDLREISGSNVLEDAVLNIVQIVVRNGAVLPEFPKPGLLRSLAKGINHGI